MALVLLMLMLQVLMLAYISPTHCGLNIMVQLQ
jgi:hypothetical protein